MIFIIDEVKEKTKCVHRGNNQRHNYLWNLERLNIFLIAGPTLEVKSERKSFTLLPNVATMAKLSLTKDFVEQKIAAIQAIATDVWLEGNLFHLQYYLEQLSILLSDHPKEANKVAIIIDKTISNLETALVSSYNRKLQGKNIPHASLKKNVWELLISVKDFYKKDTGQPTIPIPSEYALQTLIKLSRLNDAAVIVDMHQFIWELWALFNKHRNHE